MDYTVEFDSELLKQFPQEEHFMYKEAISHKVTEYLEHNFFRIKPVRTRSGKRNIRDRKSKLIKKLSHSIFALKKSCVHFYISSNFAKIVFDKEVSKKNKIAEHWRDRLSDTKSILLFF